MGTVKIFWRYEPEDYFEDEYLTAENGIEVKFIKGEVIAIVEEEEYDADPNIRIRLDSFVESILDGIRLQSFNDYGLSKGAVERIGKDGNKNVIISVHSFGLVIMSGNVDLVHKTADGEIVGDTKAERIIEKQKMAELVAKAKGKETDFDEMMHSWEKSIKNPDSEFVYLFEIREALQKIFGGKTEMIKSLRLKRDEYKDFGTLTCDDPVYEGRHAGKHYGSLRAATYKEKERVREIARKMIIQYAKYRGIG